VDTDAVAASAVSSRTRRCEVKELLNARDARIVLFVGELAPEKSIDRLLRAFVNVRRMHHNVICVVVGDGQERRHLEQLSYELGVSDGVRFVGRVVEGISDYFEAADVFVLPGLGGLGISEALAHGLPVLCSGGDGTEIDLVVDGKTGRRVDPNLSEGEIINLYSETLLEWLGDDKLLQCLAEGAYDHAHKQFSFSKFIDKIMEAIRYAVRLPQ
jgi:glycosyltransferase involved in cell wall biosynthesis